MEKKICVVTGVGPGTGLAIVKRFAQTYKVAMIARNEERLSSIQESVPHTKKYPCNVIDSNALNKTWESITRELGQPDIVIHNAVRGTFGTFDTVAVEDLEKNFAVNVTAMLRLAQLAAPAMIEKKNGVILATGNTAAYRGVPMFAGFAPTKAAQRILLESVARSVGPKGIHVGFISVDAVIDLTPARTDFPEKPDDFFCKPSDIAEQTWVLAHQPRSAWTFDLTIRPFGERW